MSRLPAIERKLTTIMSADAANYSGRMAADEVGTVQLLRKSFAAIGILIEQRGGRIANTAGDGLIAEFPSVVEATAAAVAIQQKLLKDPGYLSFRIGLHLGDVIVEGEDLLGDGVNLAARLQDIAPEGGIVVSQQIYDHAKGRLTAEFRPLGPTSLKHMPEDIAVYGLVADGITAPNDLVDVIPPSQPTHSVTHHRKSAVTPRTKQLGRQARIWLMIVFLIVMDIVTGPGTWAFWPIAAYVTFSVISRFRAK